MNITLMSAISLVCLDGVLAARPLAEAQPAPIVLASAVAPASAKQSVESDAPLPAVAPMVVAQVDPEPETQPSAESESAAEELPLDKPLVFEGESDDAIVTKLTEYLEALDTLQGDFRQVSPSGAASTGRFYLRRPGFLRFEYDDPTPLLIVANGGMVYVRDDALETTDSYPVGQTPLKFLLRKKVDLEDARVVSVDRGFDNFAVTFASEDDETEGELTIIASAPDISLTRWVVRDLQNGITEVTLSDVATGMKLANRLFRVPEAGGDFLKN